MSVTEEQKFFNFLQRYDLHKYHSRFVALGVTKISHLKAVDEADLEGAGLTRPERARLIKKLEKNFSVSGKIKNAILNKSSKFDGPSSPAPAHKPREQRPARGHSAAIIPRSEVKLGRQIGQGAHGAVHEGVWSNVHGSVVVAIKTLYAKQDDGVHETFIKEADSMSCLNHTHIVKLYGIVLSSPLMLVVELAPMGNLHAYLKKSGRGMNIQLMHTYACQIADAMKYLESLRIVHRDLATRNVLMQSEDMVKLSDFGMARVLDKHSDVYNLSNLQSRIPIAWAALEALVQAKFSSASDVWSYAVLLWEVYSLGESPMEGLTPIEVRDKLVQGERLGRPERCPADVYQLMLSCWQTDPQDRPTFRVLHQKIQDLAPRMVRAVQPHALEVSANSLSFRTGEVLYVIEKPKPGWLFGMKAGGGETGLFLEDHVSAEMDPLGALREQVHQGRSKVAKMAITYPHFVSHEFHWGRDGQQWALDSDDSTVRDLSHNTSGGSCTSSSRSNSCSPRTRHSSESYRPSQSGRSGRLAGRGSVGSFEALGRGGRPAAGEERLEEEQWQVQLCSPDKEPGNDEYVSIELNATRRLAATSAESTAEEYVQMEVDNSHLSQLLCVVDQTGTLVAADSDAPSRETEPQLPLPLDKPVLPEPIVPSRSGLRHLTSPTSTGSLSCDGAEGSGFSASGLLGSPTSLSRTSSRGERSSVSATPPPWHEAEKPLWGKKARSEFCSPEPQTKLNPFLPRTPTPPNTQAMLSAQLQDVLQSEFPDAAPRVVSALLQQEGFDVTKARVAMQVEMLMDMGIPHTTRQDCSIALKHCQWKVDRAAEWLLEKNL